MKGNATSVHGSSRLVACWEVQLGDQGLLSQHRDLRFIETAGRLEAAPVLQGNATEPNNHELTHNEGQQGPERLIHKAVRMQTHTEHVDTKPRQTGHHVSEYRHEGCFAVSRVTPPPCVQNNRIPQNYKKCSIFFRVPAPETAPGLIRPNATQDRCNKTAQCCEADDAVHHSAKRF